MINKKKTFFVGIGFVLAFILWTVSVCFIDVQTIGPQNSSVGFATLNGFIHKLIGSNMDLYTVTDWLSILPIVIVFGFAIFGLIQWIKRKKFVKVDYSIIVLGGFYIFVMAVYIFFEMIAINYRPVLIDGYLESSYPSSTTMLVMCVMPTAMMQFCARIKNKIIRRYIMILITVFTAFMIIGRIISGVHWITDIIGGAFISTGLVLIYYSICGLEL